MNKPRSATAWVVGLAAKPEALEAQLKKYAAVRPAFAFWHWRSRSASEINWAKRSKEDR